jgi:zinc transport system substrate-binding protein
MPPVHALVARVMVGVGEPTLLIPGTASPHAFSLRPSDGRILAAADIVVWVGPALETSLTGPLTTLAGGAHRVTLSEAAGIRLLPARTGGVWGEHAHDDDEHAENRHDEAGHGEAGHGEAGHGEAGHGEAGHGDRDDGHGDAHAESGPAGEAGIDAHVWLDTGNARAIVAAVAAALIDRDPAHGAAYAANREAALGELDALTARLRATFEPVRGRPFVVLHDGYQYLERQFGLTGAGAIAVSPDIRPGARRLAELRATIRERGARCIFAEPQVAPAPVRAIAADTGARIGLLDPIGAGIAPGPDLYPRLMLDLAESFRACLAEAG